MAAAPTYVATGAVANTTDPVTGITPALPTGWAVDDIFILTVEYDPPVAGDGFLNETTGWTVIEEVKQGAGSTMLSVKWRRAESGDTAPTVTSANSQWNHLIGCISAFRGCIASGSPIDLYTTESESGAGGGGGPPPATWPTLTTSVANTRIVHMLATSYDNAGSFISAESNDDQLTGLTEIFDQGTTDSNGGMISGLTAVAPNPATIGTTSATAAATTDRSLMSLALLPVPDTNLERSFGVII